MDMPLALRNVVFACRLLAGAPAFAVEVDLQTARAELESAFAADVGALADWCDERQLPEQAATTRAWLRPADPRRLHLIDLPRDVGRVPLPKDTPSDVFEWDRRFHTLRHEQGAKLFDLARQAIRAKRASLAMELVLAALREDPDHAAGRRLLGYQPFRGQWRTAYEVRKLQGGQVWDERFGWLPKNHLTRYEAGERFSDGGWKSAEEDARLHRDINRGWKIETDHYRVTTNHSLEAGVQLGVKLEALYQAWRQVFLRYYASDAEIAQLFEGRASAKRNARRHEVLYFRDRDEYQQALRGQVPPDVQTTGIYIGDHKTAYFFAPEPDSAEAAEDSTLYHEATHQLFSESRPVVADIGRQANFWIVEGVACYMESFNPATGDHTVGGADTPRYVAARFRLIDDNFYVPLADFCGYGMQKLQRDERIAMLYSQASGLTHFLMHYGGGKYRDALVRYLEAVYTGRDQPGSLAELCGVPFEELDKQYREFMEMQVEE
jgi:hypothetical protein